MKGTRVNPTALSPMEMNNMSSMMGMMNSIQKIGKGKRKYTIQLDKNDKKLLVRFINEAKKQVYNFLNYITDVASKKESTEIKMSYEEQDFVKRMLQDSVRGMEKMQFFWYQFIRKFTVKTLTKQYRELLKKF